MPIFGTRFKFPGQLRIRSYLTALVLSCLVPVCLASVYLVDTSYRNRIALQDQHLLAAANILSAALDRDLAITRASLEALATSPAIASGDMATVHAQALNVLKNLNGSDIIMADETGQQVINSFKPFGSPLPKRSPREAVADVFTTGLPRITNVFKGAVTGRYLIGVDVPVFQDGRVRYDLAMTRPVDHLSALVRTQELPREWLITILDSDKVIAERSHLPEAYIGKHVESPTLLRIMTDAHQGSTEGLNLEGAPSRISFYRSEMTGWTVLISVPQEVLAQDLRRWLHWVIGGLSVLIVFGLTLALLITRFIARSVQDLIPPALALGQGETIPMGHFALVETAEVANALERAADLLAKHDAARDHAHQLLQEAGSTLRSNMARLELVNAELQEFAFVASHDLQEPLRKIQTFCDMARKRCAPALDSTGTEYMDRVINSASRMRQLLHALLAFSSVASIPEPFKKIDLNLPAREAANIFELSCIESGCQIQIDDLPFIDAHENQILQLFQNLIGNAIKYSGSDTPKIRIYGKLDGETTCEIRVEDKGIGFDQRFAERIFKPFQRLHGRDKYEGTGMGLAICRKIVERHGGTIRAVSEPGQGASFIIRLPLKQARVEHIGNIQRIS